MILTLIVNCCGVLMVLKFSNLIASNDMSQTELAT